MLPITSFGLGSYGAFGNQSGGSFGGGRMDSHRGGNIGERDNRVSDQMHAILFIIYII